MLFDTHCHLDMDAFDGDRDGVLQRAREAGIQYIVNPAYDMVSSRRVVRFVAEQDGMYAAIGIHPNDLAALNGNSLAELLTLASYPKIVAIGEIGLDYHWNTFPPDRQKAGFVAQLELAGSLGLPVIVHCRDAYDDVLDILEEHALEGRVLLHAFAGNGAQAERALARGCTLGIGGPITYKKADALRQIVGDAPLSQLVLETDAPYLAPHPHRGKRNEPSFLLLTAVKVSEVRNMPVEEVAQVTTSTACGFFGLT